MKRPFRLTVSLAALLLSIPLFVSSARAASRDDLEAIRAEIAQMKTQYESQIQQLEQQVASLQRKHVENASAIESLRIAEIINSQYGPLVGYSTESAQANAPDTISAMESMWKGKIAPEPFPDIKAEMGEPPAPPAGPYADLMTSGTPFFDKLPESLPPYLIKGFEYHGYLRSGFGVNNKGGQQVPFQAPGAPAKYRLGNETETYGEMAFVYRFNPEKKGPAFDVQIRPAFHTDELMSWNLAVGSNKFLLREAFCSAKNLGWDWSPDIEFWAGERFYRRLDIHINDFYVYDMSGYGGGFEDMDIPLWDTKLAVAYIGGSSDDYEFPKAGRVAKNSIDIRWYDLDVPWGKWTTWIAPSAVASGTYTNSAGNTVSYPHAGGTAVGFIHMHQIDPIGYNQITGQYGFGTGSDFSPNIQDPTSKLRDSWRFRLTESNVVQVNEHLSIMTDGIYQASDDGTEGQSKMTWVSAGCRPVYYFNKCVALALETGLDYIDNQLDQYEGLLYKVTLAPMIKIDNTFMGRPEIRAYVTYAGWTNGFKGRVGGTAYEGAQEGLAAGVQCEAWW